MESENDTRGSKRVFPDITAYRDNERIFMVVFPAQHTEHI